MSSQFDLRQSMASLFATPLVNHQFDDLPNPQLETLILRLEEASPGVRRSNVGGWHSEPDLFDTADADLDVLRQRLRSIVDEVLCRTSKARTKPPVYHLDAWANVLRDGEYNGVHSHPNSIWSGVYYVTGNPDTNKMRAFSGRLELLDPRPGASLTFAEESTLYGRCLINPIPGQVVIFPGWLSHMVHPYFGDTPRISIAFNAVLGDAT